MEEGVTPEADTPDIRLAGMGRAPTHGRVTPAVTSVGCTFSEDIRGGN